MASTQIRELTTGAEFSEAFTLLETLYPDLTRERYEALLPTVREQGYRQFALLADGDVVSVAGVRRGTNFSSGAYVYVDDLVTAPAHRSQGYGAELLEYVHRWARERGCETVRLVASADRRDAHRFYEDRMGYERRGYYFKRRLREGATD